MFSWKEFEKIKMILSHIGGNQYGDYLNQHHINVRPENLLDWIEFIKEDLGFITVADIASFEKSDSQIEIVYQLLNMEIHQRLNLHLIVNRGENIPSIVKFFLHSDWPEREQAEVLNLHFDRKTEPLILPDPKAIRDLPILRFNPNKSEAPYPEESYLWKRFDLLSPITNGNFEWDVCFDPDKVIDSRVKIGFHHQGLERLLQNKDIFQILQLVDKINLVSSPHYSILWTKTIEEMFRIKIPERAQALRIVMLELSRIASHLTVLQAICFESGQDEFLQFINAREKIYELFEKYSGHRQGVGISTFGGMKKDLPQGWVVEFQNASDVLKKNLQLLHKSLLGQNNFRRHLEGEAVNAQSILQWGITGPAMRAAGLNFDLRKSQSYYFYKDIDFDIPVGIHGSIFDRFLIRYEEVFQSLRIITQVIDNLPLGEVIPDNYNKNYLELVEVFATLDFPQEWHYSSIESPSGEAGYMLKLSDNLKPSRIKLKTPGFSLAAALPIFSKGLREGQLLTNLASLGLSRWEMDR